MTRRCKAPTVPSRAPVAGFPGSVSGPCGARPGSPWPAPFSPPPPPALAHQNHCSGASSILWGCPTPCIRASRAYPVGSPYGPGHPSPGQRQGLPGSAHRVAVHAEVADPAPGPSPPHPHGVAAVACRVCGARRHPRQAPLARLPTLPVPSPVNASCVPLPIHPHDSGPVWWAGPSLSGTCTLHHCAGLSRR
jgi:hypothetical protein